VTGGLVKGIVLRRPSRNVTRPTSARVREALFSSLGDIYHSRVVELFAGSGILGLEALSRGAKSGTFVESDRAAAKIVRSNLRQSGFADCSRVLAQPVESFLMSTEARFDLVIADPPYQYSDIEWLIARASEKLAAEHGVLVLEHAASRSLPQLAALVPSRTRIHGDSAFTVYVWR